MFISLALGVLVAILLTALTDWRLATRLLVGWDIYVGLYLVLVAHVVWVCDVHRIRVRAAREDEGQLTLLVLTVTAALASLGAIVAELGSSAGVPRRPSHVILAVLTILLSWAFIHTIFALHYAHEFYDDDKGGGLAFPGRNPEPDYWDFVYFSFVIGMTSQVSDVGVTSTRIRRTVTAHGVVAFAFNAALLALSVNIAASVI